MDIFFEIKSISLPCFKKNKVVILLKFYLLIKEVNSLQAMPLSKIEQQSKKNRVSIETTRCMLKEKVISKEFWIKVVNIIVNLLNRFPSKTAQGKTPYKTQLNRKSDISHLNVFGCVTYFHVPIEKKVLNTYLWDIVMRQKVFHLQFIITPYNNVILFLMKKSFEF